jgi:hypothetical protein
VVPLPSTYGDGAVFDIPFDILAVRSPVLPGTTLRTGRQF